jgi:hypothetical protein
MQSASPNLERNPSLASTLYSSSSAGPNSYNAARPGTARHESHASNVSISPASSIAPYSDSGKDHAPIYHQVTQPEHKPLSYRSARGSVRNRSDGLYELDAEPKTRVLGKLETRENAMSTLADDKSRNEVVQPLEERLRALEDMVLRMTAKGNGTAPGGGGMPRNRTQSNTHIV